MTRRIVVERAAEEDMRQAVRYYVRHRSPATAQRFVTAVEDTFTRLADTPDIGRRYQTTDPRLQHLHIWRVRGFERYLIFYSATEETLLVTRVLYGTRDIAQILQEHAGEPDE